MRHLDISTLYYTLSTCFQEKIIYIIPLFTIAHSTMHIIQKTREFFNERVDNYWKDPFGLKWHVILVENQIKKVLQKNIWANELVCILSCRLHDIWHYPVLEWEDHAIIWEKISREFLSKQWLDDNIVNQVSHCVRSHRCKDVMPETLEAKILAFCDSASHMQDSMYIEIAKDWRIDYAMGKLQRDYRDLEMFPELKKDYENLYLAWKKLLEEYKDFLDKKSD